MARIVPPFALVFCGALACSGSWLARIAHADAPLRTVVFRTASAAADVDVAAAVDPLVLAQLDARTDLQVAARPALDLPATQIAIDCIGETQACWSAVLTQYPNADVLIAPSIQRAGEETVVTFLYVDPRGTGEFRTVVGRYRGADVAHQALDAVPSMLRALLNSSASEAPAAPAAAPAPARVPAPSVAPETAAAASPPSERASAFPIVPVVLLVSSVAIAGTGLAFGLAASRNQNRYDAAGTDTPSAIDDAIELRDRAHHQATIANVAYGTAAAVFALGATWLIVDLSSGDEPERARLSASLGPSAFGVALHASLPRTW